MKRVFIFLFFLAAFRAGALPPDLPEATAEKLPRWRGFNLLEKFNAGNAGPFREEDFQMISELGFNFVRLPMDYRIWIKNGDWRQFNDDALADVDAAVALGKKYGVHVCLNFHRAPGYTVATPKEAKDLWTDADALEVCAMHWAHFAKRYKGIPNNNLSFDLLNEPTDVKPEAHARVIGTLVEAIRKEDPARLIIADGRAWGTKPCHELVGLHIAQATRGYAPFQLTHYKAEWANGGSLSVPMWPVPRVFSPLYGPGKKPWNVPLVIAGDLPTGTLRIRVHEVSGADKFIVRGDGEKIWERTFAPGAGDADCKSVDKKKAWPFGTYDRDYSVPLRAGLKKIEMEIADGDWISVPEIGISKTGSRECVLGLAPDWGRTNSVINFAGVDAPSPFVASENFDRARLWSENIEPWKQLEKEGIGIIVGEWGAYHHTPHDVTLRWMEDCLQNWKNAGWGWAVWNFRGPFGPLDSGRADVNYESFHGHKLDRAMADLLKKY